MVTNYKEIVAENIKKYGTDIGKYGPVLLTGLYSDRTHFIYEIIQNAEDAGARIGKNVQINFNLFKDRLEIRHNGKLFDEADVRGICGLVEGTKKDNLAQIGKFGIGFKSVYAYTKSPEIYSGDESFCIKNYVLPEAIEQIDISENETIFIFPFNHSEVHSEQAFEEIANRLRNIGMRTLLFLKYIEEISWNIHKEKSGIYIREVKTKEDYKEAYILSKVGEDEQNEKSEEWIVFERLFKLDIFGVDALRIEVAFKIGKDKNGKEIIVEAENCKLAVFFPTEKPTYLKFLIQGPYKTTANRENIPLEDEQNKLIIKETVELISESISRIKRLGYLDVNFLSILPIDPNSARLEGELIYAGVYEKVKSKLFSDEELLPTNDGRYVRSSDALLAGSKDLTEILNQGDVEFLFSKKNWLSTEITNDRTKELRKYLLSELGVNEIEFKNFAENISSEFLEKKSDEWMIRFYCQLLSSQNALWRERTGYRTEGILRKKPIIRLEDNSHIAPYDEFGNMQVYLPTERKSEYKTIKKIFTEDESSLQFLKELGVKKPDIFAEIKEFVIPKYHGEKIISEKNYFEDLEKIITAFSEGSDDNARKELLNQLSELKFIKAVNLISKEEKYLKPSEVYLNSEELRRYFDGYKSAFFVSKELYLKCKHEEDILRQFLKAVGVEDKPRRLEIKKVLSGEEKICFIKEHIDGSPVMRNREISKTDYEYEGLLNIMKYINKAKSMLLWTMLLKSIEELNSSSSVFFKGRYHYEYRGKCSRGVDAAFLIVLRKNPWLFDKDDKLKLPSEITFSELSDDYKKESRNIEILKEELKFKPNSFDQLPEDVKRKCEIIKDRSIEEIKKALKLLDEKKLAEIGKKERQWKECEPEELVDIESEIVTPQPHELPNLVNQGIRLGNFIISDKDKPVEKREKEENVPIVSPMQKKEIGDWGEKCVLVDLKNQYKKLGNIIDTEFGFYVSYENNKIEVYWLNIKSEIGKGCDFVIRENGIESEYIEVKAKLREEDELIEITGTQWEFARKLFDNNDGDKYWIYIVVNAGKRHGSKIIKLQNPIKEWKDGRLYAHPIHFKL